MTSIHLMIQPDPDEPGAAEVLVDATIAGRLYRCLLDTGAARTTLPYDSWTAAFPVTGTHAGSGVFNAFQDELVTVPEIILGPIHVSNQTVTRSAAGSPDPRALIGMDLLKDHRLHFQFHRSRVEVDPVDTGPVRAGQVLWMDQGGHPYVQVEFGAVQAQAVWDTAASVTVVDAQFSQRHPELFEPDGMSVGTDATGSSMSTPMLRMASSMIGGVQFGTQRVAAVDLSIPNATLEVPMDLILGFNVLSQCDWVFDFPTRRWGVCRLDRSAGR